jgi:FkbM family methyltransferase
MNTELFFLRLKKIFVVFTNIKYFNSFLKVGVTPSIEHQNLFKDYKFNKLIDVGGNIGQFSLFASQKNINKILIFEPIISCTKKIRKIFKNDKNIKIFNYALGNKKTIKKIYITNKIDSSSFFKPSSLLQKELKIHSNHTEKVKIFRADEILNKELKTDRILLKIDTQGYELEVLKGFGKKISSIYAIYCECSYIKMYQCQPVFKDIEQYLNNKNFYLEKIYNKSFLGNKKLFQADFLFLNKNLSTKIK